MSKSSPLHKWVYRGNSSGCWLVPSQQNKYPQISRCGKSYKVVTYLYICRFGEIPTGMILDHVVCNDPWCVNPHHVKVTTQADNVRRSNVAVLTMRQAQRIRMCLAEGETAQDLAMKYGVCDGVIYNIKHGRTWNEETNSHLRK